MRISALSLGFNKDLRSNKSQVASPVFVRPCDTFIQTKPSFGSIGHSELFYKALSLRKVLNLPCAYTGVPMLPPKIFIKTFAENTKAHTLEESIRNLSKFKKNMNKVEKSVFERVLHTPNARSAETLHDAMVVLRKEHLNRLNRIQLRILDNIDKMAEKLPPEEIQLVKVPTQMSRDLILNDDVNITFKRKTLIKWLGTNLLQSQDKSTFKKIVNYSRKLPSSSDNQYAFIAKYSKNDRSSKEIEERLLCTSRASFDHKIPQDLGGENVAENVIIVSAISNSRKSNAEPYKWFKDNEKEVRKNSQKQINFLINLNNKHYMSDIGWYILCLKNSIFDISKGAINLDTSKLKLDKRNIKMIREIQECFPETFGNRGVKEIEIFIQKHSPSYRRSHLLNV